MAFAVAAGQLSITTPALLPPATQGVAYSQFLDAIGGVPPYTWTLLATTGPDAWAVTNPGSNRGLITGTPGQATRITGSGALRVINGNVLRIT